SRPPGRPPASQAIPRTPDRRRNLPNGPAFVPSGQPCTRLPDSYRSCHRPSAQRRSVVQRNRGADPGRTKGWSMTAGSNAIGDPGNAIVDAGKKSRPTRRGVLLGASLAGLGGALAGCSTAPVPYGASEAGVVDQNSQDPGAMTSSGPMSGSGGGRPASPATGKAGKPEKGAMGPKVTGTVLGAASEIPVGGGKIFTA